MKHKFEISIFTLAILCMVLAFCSCSNYRYSDSIAISHKKASKQYIRDVQAAMKGVENGRSDKRNKALIDSAINAMIKDCESDTVFIVECCNPPSYVYGISIWDRTNAFNLAHRLDYFSKDTCLWIDYRLVDLITKWDTKEIVNTSNAHPLAAYNSWTFYEIATRLIYKKRKLIDSQTIIYHEINFDSDNIPAFID